MTTTEQTTATHGTVCDIPLNRLKKSPRNARKTPHSSDAIEALAASIALKGMLQAPVVEPELDAEGLPTGDYFVTIGEGRRQAQLLRAKRKEIKKTEPVRCVINTEHDAHEISLDENITRSAMHPADQFEAFQRLSVEQGLGAEKIGARFGVAAGLVRQRLRLAAVSPRLMEAYRSAELTLEQLMAFTVVDDQQRQEAVWDTLPEYERSPHTIRRRLTHDRVSGTDRRALFVGAEAYEAAGGIIERDLFADDQGGYFASPVLLDTLALERLDAIAAELLSDGWKWAEATIDRPHTHGLPRFYPQVREFTLEEQSAYDALTAEQDSLAAQAWSESGEARLIELEEQISQLDGARLSFDPEAKARGGVFVFLTPEGAARAELGFLRPDDNISDEGDEGEDSAPEPAKNERVKPDRPRLPDKLVAELTAHRTAALRNEVAEQPQVALLTLLHALVLRTFSLRHGERSCMEVRPGGAELTGYAPGIEETPAGRAIRERHEVWSARLDGAESIEAFIDSLEPAEAMGLLAHCVSLTVSDVRMRDGVWTGTAPSDRLAARVGLDMSRYWTPTAENYFSRVSKTRILEAATEAASPDAAKRIEGAKKPEMAAAAEQLVSGTGWLPEPLRTANDTPPEAIAAE